MTPGESEMLERRLNKTMDENAQTLTRSQDVERNLHDALSHAWSILYPDTPDSWEYPSQVGNHIRVEIERLRWEVERLRVICFEVLGETHHADDCMIYHGKPPYCSCMAEGMRKLLKAALVNKKV